MPKPMDYTKFIQWLREMGYIVTQSTKHHEVRRKSDNQLIERFAVHHAKGSKKEVKGPYIKNIETAIKKNQTSD